MRHKAAHSSDAPRTCHLHRTEKHAAHMAGAAARAAGDAATLRAAIAQTRPGVKRARRLALDILSTKTIVFCQITPNWKSSAQT